MNQFLVYLGGAILFSFFIHYLLKFIKHKSLYPFMPFKYNFRRRRITFAKTLELLSERNVKVILETGTSRKGLSATRSDGASTFVFGKWASENDAKLYSIDLSPDSVKECKAEVDEQQLQDHVSVVLSDSLEYLNTFEEKIDFLYLDSYDYSKTNTEIQRKSQEHHLQEFKNAENKLHKDTIVLIDDCGLPAGGKGKLAIEYMKTKNWEVVIDAYQVLLINKDTGYIK